MDMKMNVSFIGCWYRGDMYSHHFMSLIRGMDKNDGLNVKLITSNCNCFSSAQRFGIARDELLNDKCKVVKLPYAPLEPNKKYGLLKYNLVKHSRLNYFLDMARGMSFFFRCRDADIIHFDQVLRAFGILSFTALLACAKMFGKKVVVTVHELDPLQERYKGLSKFYNLADKVLVFSEGFRDELKGLGVRDEKIEIVPYAVSLEPIKYYKREGFIFFGGHKLLKGKGFDTLLDALKIVRSKGRKTSVVIYAGKGCNGLEDGKQRVADEGLEEFISWRDFLWGPMLCEAYQKSVGCIIPFTSGSGRHPATSAMANATPVIATRKAALPEYLGDLGIFIDEGSAEELADAMTHLLDHHDAVISSGTKLRERAEKFFSAETITKRLVAIYREVKNS
ncbi:MAG: glycosyltransferase family 4 protein [Nitrospirota bacterium]